MAKLETITNLKNAVIIGSDNNDEKQQTFLQLTEGGELYEIISDNGNDGAVYPDDSFIEIDGVKYVFNSDMIGHTETRPAAFFAY